MTSTDQAHGTATGLSPGKRTTVLPVRAATIGLGLVLLVLTAFSVAVAITNADGTHRAQRSAYESDLFEKAWEELLAEEAGAENVVAEDDAEAREEYGTAHRATHAALRHLHKVHTDEHGVDEVAGLLRRHGQYGAAVQDMFRVALATPDTAEDYEEAFVDPHFDPLEATLAEHVQTEYEEARAALNSIERAQAKLLVATPVLFGVSLLLLTIFVLTLSRNRRLIAAQAEMNRHQSLHDALTGLPNRTLLHQRAQACLEKSAADGSRVALMLLDLDRFKEINDTLGHNYGDLVLQAVTRRLRAAVRATDTVARLGGDEFAILCPDVRDVASAMRIADNVQTALSNSVDIGDILLDVDISMGIAMSGEHGDDVDSLLQHADVAMYRAKERDLGICVYDEEFNDHSPTQLGLLGELRRALDRDELVLHFQPKFALAGGGFNGAEALLRWDHPTRGMIPPGVFIPAAERTAIIRPLTLWVLNAALAQCKGWQDQGNTLKLAVNVSARNLLDPSFGDDVLDLLARWDLPASALALEVTESAIMVDPHVAEITLRRFAELGIEIAIDDFGAGYTSLGHLRTLPVQELKIDQSLVRDMATSATATIIVRGIIDLAQSLGLRTVAEGVEDSATLEQLSELGCDLAQGFYLARPMPAADLSQWSHGVLANPGLASP